MMKPEIIEPPETAEVRSKTCPVCQEKFSPKPDQSEEEWERQTYCSRLCWRGGR